MSKPIYRPLFLEAFKITWHHKRLWFLGIFASFMAAGGLFETLSGSWKTAITGRSLIEQTINGTLPGFRWLIAYGRYLAELSTIHQYFLTLFFVLILAAGLIFGALCQGAILNHALEKKLTGFHGLFKKSWHFLGRIFCLDLLGKLFLFVIFLITVAPVAFLNPLPYGWQKFPPLISFVLFLIGAAIITTIQMLSLNAAVRKNQNPWAALNEAWHIFRLHFLVSVELGVLLFFTSILAMLATFVVVYILALPITLLFLLATIVASPTLYIISIIFSFVLILAIILLIFGWLTAFQYTTWALFFEEMDRFGIVSWVKRKLKK